MEVTSTCPECSHKRKKKAVKCLSTNTESGVFYCNHCGFSGIGEKPVGQNVITPNIFAAITKATTALETALPANVVKWFCSRGISEQVLARNTIGYSSRGIMFPYFRNKAMVNVKYRTVDKKFSQETGGEKVLYGIDDIEDSKVVIFCEGEMDKLSLEEAGFKNAVSVPDGAPAANTKAYTSKFSFLDDGEEVFKYVESIIMACDNDSPGYILTTELIRRLGAERCWVVKWPDGCKDANDVLVRDGKQALQSCIESAIPAPIEGLFAANECAPAVRVLYEEGLAGGVSTGWIGLDMFYTVKPGEFTVITGVPNHGKTKFQTALMVNLAISSEWKFAVFSPENTPAGFIAHLASLYHGKPFRKGLTQRLTPEELETVLVWVNEHFCFIQPPDEELTIEDILIKAKQSVARYGINGLVIDPWNDIDHSRPPGMTGTEYISGCLTKIRRFAKKYNVHIWLVAHPAKMYKDAAGNYPVPTPYDISGSAHFRNKADNCITVWRDLGSEKPKTEIHIQKIRFREVGKIGMSELIHDDTTYRYVENTP